MKNEKHFVAVTDLEINHVEKYNLSKVYKFDINKTLNQLEFDGLGGEHRGRKFQKLLGSLK